MWVAVMGGEDKDDVFSFNLFCVSLLQLKATHAFV